MTVIVFAISPLVFIYTRRKINFMYKSQIPSTKTNVQKFKIDLKTHKDYPLATTPMRRLDSLTNLN